MHPKTVLGIKFGDLLILRTEHDISEIGAGRAIRGLAQTVFEIDFPEKTE
jgi:hypothetical protein